MPEFEDRARSDAPPEDVWKLLYDPARFPDWWTGIGSVEPGQDGGYTMYPQGYPDFPMAQELHVTPSAVSVQVKGLELRLGVQLFQRLHRQLVLTNVGEAYLEPVRESFARIAKATKDLKPSRREDLFVRP